MNDYIFSLDPGSIRSGWAFVDCSGQLIEAGLLLPDKKTAEVEFRLNDMCRGMVTLLNKHMPKTILIEWPSGHVGRKHHHGGGAGLSTYGIAVGALWREIIGWRRQLPADDAIQVNIHLILENIWTRSMPKAERAAAIAATFPEYRPGEDKGMDISDALGLAVWYGRRQMLKLAEAIV